MTFVKIPNAGSIGVISDLSQHELPINAWTSCQNIRFLDGYAYQFLGHSECYNSPSVAPQYIMPINVTGVRYWLYMSNSKAFVTTVTGGAAVHTDITHATPHAGLVNQWTGTVLGGIPILNVGDTSKVPMYWDLNLANKFVNLSNWPAGVYCKSFRSFKNYGIALNITKPGLTYYPFMVKWSHPADPGSLPSSWDHTDATKDAGEVDLSEGYDPIIDGLQLRDSFMIYKEASVWRMDYVGGPFVFRFSKVLGTSGALNRNCIVDIDGAHVVLTGSDIVVHDGQSATSVLDKQTRRYFFQHIDVDSIDKCFLFKNPFLNEVFICYPSVGSSVCDSAVVWNYKDKTVSFRTLPNINHANFGPVDNSLGGLWSSDPDPWDSDSTLWDGPDFTPDTARAIMAGSGSKLFLLDGSASFDGVIPSAYLERSGLSFDNAESRKLIKGIRPRIYGVSGTTVNVYVGASDDPYSDPVYSSAMTHTIGSTIANDCLVNGRYIAVKFASGTAYQWRLDSYDIDVDTTGKW